MYAAGGPVLERGVGTGRLALPLVAAGGAADGAPGRVAAAMVALLLRGGAAPRARDANKWSALHHAAYAGCAEAVALLLGSTPLCFVGGHLAAGPLPAPLPCSTPVPAGTRGGGGCWGRASAC